MPIAAIYIVQIVACCQLDTNNKADQQANIAICSPCPIIGDTNKREEKHKTITLRL